MSQEQWPFYATVYQRDHNVIPTAETIPSKCQIVQKQPKTVQVTMVLTESKNFISL